jgi:hypothetical protein
VGGGTYFGRRRSTPSGLIVTVDVVCATALYDAFLRLLNRRKGGWHALPKDVARWWKTRADLRCEPLPGEGAKIVGGPCDGATVAYARDESDRIVFDREAPDRTPTAEGQATQYDLRR